MYDGAHLILAALRKVAVIAVGAGGGAPIHDKVAALVHARRAIRVVGIVLRAKIVSHLMSERDLRHGLRHARLVIDHSHNAAVEALGHALQGLPPLAHPTHTARQLGHPGKSKCAVSKIPGRKRIRQTVLVKIVQRDVV